MQRHHHPPSATISPAGATIDADQLKRGKKRGNYNCGRCGQPKKGHSCHVSTPTTTTSTTIDDSSAVVPFLTYHSPPPLHPHSKLRRALSFEDDNDSSPAFDGDYYNADSPENASDADGSGLPFICLWEVLRRLPPAALLSATGVCRGWRNCAKRVWRAAEELRLRVPPKAEVRFLGSVLQKCSGLVSLSLRMESVLDATMLACIAFACPNLEAMEVSISDNGANRITGDELSRFVSEKRCLSSLKMEGCSNLGYFTLSSSSLSTLWLSDLYSLSKMIFNCPNLKELSLDFSCLENDSTELTTLVDGLGRSCPRLRKIHIASHRLSHAVVLALTAANLRGLRMISLVLGSELTDASVVAIASCYPNLELLDLSGSSISDSGIGIICNEFHETLSRLLLALCPNITSSGIQFAVAQLPLLELMDCGMTICDPNSQNVSEENGSNSDDTGRAPNYMQETPKRKLQLVYQKLIIKHARLKKLSLWGCSGLDALYLNCPELNDLNLTSCTNLHPERLLLQCPNLESVHASGCHDMLIGAIQNQLCNDFAAVDEYFPCKRLADGSKRVRVPCLLTPQSSNNKKGRRVWQARCTVHVE